ncbi:abc transporter [Culex quinquefasciatus]|uniref:Abc transporter n=1 Tax=Culex quinquefasciatus TaxID=7176 RepID=B0X149_CULQU|nr:abc transporter [Culex quinquefasciatus]|eukprot:XP_001863371.1 abc transporter [Culex quinquefasciatus]
MQPVESDHVTIPLVPTGNGSAGETKLSFSGISYAIARRHGPKQVLDQLSGTFRSGRLAAIIGPSGAGKTSLLNVLGGFRTRDVRGSILINDRELSAGSYRTKVAYNTQQIALLPNITVKETLEFAVDLRTRYGKSKVRKRKTVEDVIALLGLDKCAHSQVRVISGGERKRLSIAQELISEPKIMLFDEPTSGLDSEASYQVVSYLRELARQDRCVVSVVHQPSSDLLELFDDIYVLSSGRCMYRGSLDGMIPYFENVGLVCPQYYNRADFVLKITSPSKPEISKVYQSMHQMESIVDNIQTKPKTKLSKLGSQYPTSHWHQFITLTRRSALSTIRNYILSILRLGGLILLGAMIGIIYYDIGNDASKIISNTAFLCISLALVVFINAVAVVLSFPMEITVLTREYQANCYSIAAYYFAKLATDFVPMIIGNACFHAITYYMTGQPVELDRFLRFGAILLLTGWFGQIFGLFGGSTFSIQLAPFVVPVAILTMVLFGGFFIRFNELVPFLRPLTHLSPFKYAFEGVAQSIYGFNRTDLACSAGSDDARVCPFQTGDQVLAMLDMDQADYGVDVGGLAVIVGVMHVVVYVCLWVKVR